MKERPPIFFTRLLKLFCRKSLLDELLGDLEESFLKNAQSQGLSRARRIYRSEVIQLIRPSAMRSFNFERMNHSKLIFHYVKISFRNLKNDRTHAGISLLGLVIGITTAVLILQFNLYEESYDLFHTRGNNIYRIRNQVQSIASGEIVADRASTFFAAHQYLSSEVPEITNSTHLYSGNGILTYEEVAYSEEQVLFTTASFFEMFSFELISGDLEDLDRPGVIMLSESNAKRYFGSDEAIGRLLEFNGIRISGNYKLVVGGIYKDFPDNSSFSADAIISMEQFRSFVEENSIFDPLTLEDVKWRWNEFYTFVQLRDGSNVDEVNTKIREVYHRNREQFDNKFGRKQIALLQPLNEIHLTSGLFAELTPTTNRQLLRFFYLIAVLILVIAWINYVNMATAIAITRAREVGVRKVLGAFRTQLIFQFILESFLLNLIAALISATIILLAIPYYHILIDRDVFNLFGEMGNFWGVIGLSFVLGSFAAGLYPALVLSSFRPVEALKSSLKHSSHGIILRKSLVVFQLLIASLLISGSIAINNQLNYMLSHNPGFNIDQTIVIDTPPIALRDSTYQSRIRSFMNTIRAQSSVNSVTNSSLIPGWINRFRNSCQIRSKPELESVWVSRMTTDHNFIENYGLRIIAGRGFHETLRADLSNSIIVNRATVKSFGYSRPEEMVGEEIVFPGNQTFKVVGVVDNYYQRGMHTDFEPMSIQLDSLDNGLFLSIRINGQPEQLLATLEPEFTTLFPRSPFQYRFLDEFYTQQYESDLRFQSLFNFFTSIAIFIGCLGLFGLSTFFVNQKKREMSIRKVLGASRKSILQLLLIEYLWLIVLAVSVSTPLAFWGINGWLENYAFRTDLNLGVFFLPMIVLSLIVFITISKGTFKLVNANPVDHLKND